MVDGYESTAVCPAKQQREMQKGRLNRNLLASTKIGSSPQLVNGDDGFAGYPDVGSLENLGLDKHGYKQQGTWRDVIN